MVFIDRWKLNLWFQLFQRPYERSDYCALVHNSSPVQLFETNQAITYLQRYKVVCRSVMVVQLHDRFAAAYTGPSCQ
jgi:hypothetical protein